MTGLLEARGVTKEYGARVVVRAVREVSLTVAAGEIVLIMGPNGSGKTTLLSMLGGLLRPTRGEIRVAGQPLQELSDEELTAFRLRQIGFVFQSFRLLDALSVRENVQLVMEVAARSPGSSGSSEFLGVPRVPRADQPRGTPRNSEEPRNSEKKNSDNEPRHRGTGARGNSRTEQLLERVGASHLADRSPRVLSGGEKQRVAIARALANDARIILADEPTGSLDSKAGEGAIELLRQAAREEGRAVVIVSHDARIEPHADRVIRMLDGRVVFGGVQ